MKKRVFFLAWLIIPTLFANIALAQNFQQTKRLAERGNQSAQFNLGLMYEKGQDVRQDYAQAKWWYEKAAAQGHAKAKEKLEMLKVKESPAAPPPRKSPWQ